jgi:hypothetical protein
MQQKRKKKRLSSIIKHLGAQAAQTNRTTLVDQNHNKQGNDFKKSHKWKTRQTRGHEFIRLVSSYLKHY